jgi:hypothetical protein
MNSITQLRSYKFTASKSNVSFTAPSLADACDKAKDTLRTHGKVMLGQMFFSDLGLIVISAIALGQGLYCAPGARISAYKHEPKANKTEKTLPSGKLVREFSFPLPNFL